MARKVFVSYKYGDSSVAPLEYPYYNKGTARDYVDKLMDRLEEIEIYNGEDDGNDLSQFKESTIETKLKDKIRSSSITVVLISKGMKDPVASEDDQWVPWEVRYSLLDLQGNRTKGMLAVILPEEDGTYSHYFTYSGCEYCNSRTHHYKKLFQILSGNMFNRLEPNTQTCASPQHSSAYHTGHHSYIHQVEWHNFIENPSYYLDIAENIRDCIDDYKLQKSILAEI